MPVGFLPAFLRLNTRRHAAVRLLCMCLVAAFLGLAIVGFVSVGLAEDKPDSTQSITHQVTGLFSADRVKDLEKTVEKLSGMQLVRVDFATAEAVFKYDPAKIFPKATPEQTVEQFDNLLKQASRHTFGIKPLCKTPREELKLLEIPVVGLDCKACCLAAYEAIYKLEGVEQATASFKEGLVTAWIDPAKTERKVLEEALRKKNVTLKDSPEK